MNSSHDQKLAVVFGSFSPQLMSRQRRKKNSDLTESKKKNPMPPCGDIGPLSTLRSVKALLPMLMFLLL
jgi:hypothetical protein